MSSQRGDTLLRRMPKFDIYTIAAVVLAQVTVKLSTSRAGRLRAFGVQLTLVILELTLRGVRIFASDSLRWMFFSTVVLAFPAAAAVAAAAAADQRSAEPKLSFEISGIFFPGEPGLEQHKAPKKIKS